MIEKSPEGETWLQGRSVVPGIAVGTLHFLVDDSIFISKKSSLRMRARTCVKNFFLKYQNFKYFKSIFTTIPQKMSAFTYNTPPRFLYR